MTPDPQRPDPTDHAMLRRLERLTGAVLFLVIVCLGWMLLAAYAPGLARLPNESHEVLAVLGLLTSALVLVSVVALWHTRRRT